MRKAIELGESLLGKPGTHVETKSLAETERKIRGGPSGGEAFAFAFASQEGPVSAVGAGNGQEHVHGAAGATSQPRQALSAGPFGTKHPDPLPSCFAILFVGANVPGQKNLHIDKEYGQLREAFMLARGEESWKGVVDFERDCFASSSSVMDKVTNFTPTVAHFGCHGETAGVHLSGGFLTNEKLAAALLVLNKSDRAGARRIRLVIANACMSGHLARLLSDGGIEFVIAHGEQPVGDQEAIRFSDTLYRFLGRGHSLLESFTGAALESDPYELHSPHFDPGLFKLRHDSGVGQKMFRDDGGGGSEDISKLISFVGEDCVAEILRRVREDPRHDSRAETLLKTRLSTATAAKEWVSGISESTSIGICSTVTAYAMSRTAGSVTDTDDARSQDSTEDAPSEPGDLAPVEGRWTVLGLRHDGDVAEFQLHMKQLVVKFVFGEQQRGTFWQLLMAAFMRHAKFNWGRDSEQPWLVFGKSASDQMESLESFEQILQSEAMHHPWLEKWGFKTAKRDFRKKHAHRCAVWVLDQVNP